MNAMRIAVSKVPMNAVLKEISAKIVTMTDHTATAVMQEALLVTRENLIKLALTTDKNVKVTANVVAAVAASKEEKKTHSTTDQEQLDKSVLTNISQTPVFVHDAKPTTLSSLAQ